VLLADFWLLSSFLLAPCVFTWRELLRADGDYLTLPSDLSSPRFSIARCHRGRANA